MYPFKLQHREHSHIDKHTRPIDALAIPRRSVFVSFTKYELLQLGTFRLCHAGVHGVAADGKPLDSPVWMSIGHNEQG